ncbi:MAG: glycosyltransferase [Dehalococcoidales bacterium]|nr:glycosyltransferase [Dehalococcoidales bacterium]
MKVLIQMGNVGDSIIDHLISPIARVEDIDEIMLVVRKPGPQIENIKYYCPPKCLRTIPGIAIIFEFFILITLSLCKNPGYIGGYLFFPHGLLAYIVAKITRKPIVIVLIAGPVELYSIASPVIYNPSKDLKLYGKCMLAILKSSNAIVTTGSVTKDFLVKHGVSSYKVFPVISCPNADRFYPTNETKVFDVIFVGRLAQVKNVETVLLSIKEANKIIPNIKAIIIGDGPLRNQLKEMLPELGIENNIQFLGYKKDVHVYLNKSRVLILTSKREGFPNVYLEALFCGLPAVVSNCGDITDIAKDGYNSYVVEDPADYKVFSGAISELLTNEDLYQRIARNVKDTVDRLSSYDNSIAWKNVINTAMKKQS